MKDYREPAAKLCEVAKKLNNEDLKKMALFLRQRINNPDSYVVFLGETCSGKSTIINHIIGKEILPVSSVPSTAAITEIYMDENSKDTNFYAINKDATMEELDEKAFKQLSLEPDARLERLRCRIHSKDNWDGVRLFDTPGYGSIVKEHEEVLMEFLPNCDAIVYTVSYKVGIQEEDYKFLEIASELTRNGIPIALVINRCPKGCLDNDIRVREIKQYVLGILEKTQIPLILVESFVDGKDVNDDVGRIRRFIIDSVKNEERQEELNEAFKGYLNELCEILKEETNRRIEIASMSIQERDSVKNALIKLQDDFKYAKENIIKQRFNKLMSSFNNRLETEENSLNNICKKAIDEQNVFKKDETAIFVNNHIIKYNAKKSTEELQFYLATEINEIDREVNNYLNTSIAKIENDLKIQNASNLQKTSKDIAKYYGGKVLQSGLAKYFTQFGGRGGTGAGIANAASHALKKIGDMFGKTFSRETHNTLKHILAKVGLTSTKALAAVATIIIDAATEIIDLATWKIILKKAIEKAIKAWGKEVNGVVLEEIESLKNENMMNMDKHIDELEKSIQKIGAEEKEDISSLKDQLEKIDTIERSIA